MVKRWQEGGGVGIEQGNEEFMAEMIIVMSTTEGFLKTVPSKEKHEEILQEG